MEKRGAKCNIIFGSTLVLEPLGLHEKQLKLLTNTENTLI